MLVKELISYLQKGNPEAKVVTFGWCGEAMDLDKYDVKFVFMERQGVWDTGNKSEKECNYLSIDTPDKGEEPD